ncbi:2557_t:CDS:2 [Diversispora eburnea]|uniref:2557_t:CDS:1 n=1 Tax=Diversispora eburnea TaxID=1213867 RepID=A0A9N8V286_9GLOM|nr:2557_t:CDS:2 [Diversispora eburnea]
MSNSSTKCLLNEASQQLRQELEKFSTNHLVQVNKEINQISSGLSKIDNNVENVRDNIKTMEKDLKYIKNEVFKLDPSFIPTINLINKDNLIEAKYIK